MEFEKINNMTIGFIGFGLMAGDIARCIRRECPNAKMIALNNRYPEVKYGLQLAISDGVLNDLRPALDEEFSKCDIIFLCAPVMTNIEYLPKLKEIIKEDAIITDVGSVKGDIHEAVEKNDLSANFIGGHPMAGIEKTGYEHSTDTMLKGAFYILTPTPKVSKEAIETMETITKITKSKYIMLPPEEHDIAAAAISHVPHILSYTLVNTVKEHDTEEQYMKQFAAGGFRDMTRIAASSPEMWQSIVLSNKKAILRFLSQYQIMLENFKQLLITDDDDGLYEFFKRSKDYRDTFNF